MQRLAITFVIVLALIALASAGHKAFINNMAIFKTESDAQQNCPKDTVIWLDMVSGIYYLKGQQLYGKTPNGGYVCRKDADHAGYHAATNGV